MSFAPSSSQPITIIVTQVPIPPPPPTSGLPFPLAASISVSGSNTVSSVFPEYVECGAVNCSPVCTSDIVAVSFGSQLSVTGIAFQPQSIGSTPSNSPVIANANIDIWVGNCKQGSGGGLVATVSSSSNGSYAASFTAGSELLSIIQTSSVPTLFVKVTDSSGRIGWSREVRISVSQAPPPQPCPSGTHFDATLQRCVSDTLPPPSSATQLTFSASPTSGVAPVTVQVSGNLSAGSMAVSGATILIVVNNQSQLTLTTRNDGTYSGSIQFTTPNVYVVGAEFQGTATLLPSTSTTIPINVIAQVQCSKDSDCPQGFQCQNGVCVPKSQPPPPTDLFLALAVIAGATAVGVGIAVASRKKKKRGR